MLTRFDRLLVVVAERESAAAAFEALLGAERVGEDRLGVYAARRTVLRVGGSEVELLQPDGSGTAASFLQARGAGPFAVGFAVAELGAAAEGLTRRGVDFHEEAGQLFTRPEIPGLRVVLGPDRQRKPAGLLRGLYEATHLTPDWRFATDAFAASFGLDSAAFVSIQSAEYGYEGSLAMLRPQQLDRLEIVTPRDREKTMGRFLERRGPGLYMAYGESDHTAELRDRLQEQAPGDWSGSGAESVPDNLFVHPRALAGVMIGVSRSSFAWTWSGSPERVRPAPAASP